MAREILFKAKRTDNGEWVEGYCVYKKYYPITKEGVPKYEGYKHFIHNDMYGFMLIDEKTLCQYTGLTDKNGNKIWENDVCNCIYDGRLAVRVIVWDKNELDFKGTNGKENYGTEFDYLGSCEEIEVIGNIFDNPELLGGGE